MSTLKFTADHEWVRVDGDRAYVGITNHAQTQLGDVVFVDLPAVGREVGKGEATAVVESVKAASDVYSPVTGVIVDANAALLDTPALVNDAPESDGWFFALTLTHPAELDGLMDQAAYDALIGGAD